MLRELRDQGISSIEIRYLPVRTPHEDHARVCHLIWEEGLTLTVHGGLDRECKGAHFIEMYPSLVELVTFFNRYQQEIMMVIHAFSAKADSESMAATEMKLAGESVELLRDWIAMTMADSLPLKFALELDHDYPGVAQPGKTPEDILRLLAEVDSPWIGVTWDMGHYYSNLMRHAGLKLPPKKLMDAMPPASFLENTIHTHIHGMGAKGAHYPLTLQESLPLERYVKALKAVGYTGIYNLEITLSRLSEDKIRGEIISTIERLRDCVLDD